MGKKLFIMFGCVFGLLAVSLFFDYRGNGVVDRMDLGHYEDVVSLESINEASLPDVADSFRSYVTYTSYARTSYSGETGGYGSFAGNYISISGRDIPVVDVDSTAVNAGDHVNKYGSRFYYGHNTGTVFGGLVNYGVGSSFAINYNGARHNYRVAKVVIFEKNVELGLLQLNGSGSYMNSVAAARSEGVQYDVSLMTCYGTSYGNGDASHRYVVFANEI